MFTVYSKPGCTHCDGAKQLLTIKGLPFEVLELNVGQVQQPDRKYVEVSELKNRVPNARTVPQIFHGDKLIGGFTELKIYLE